MTASEIATELADAPCLGCRTEFQLQMLQVVLLWKQLNGDVPMTAADVSSLLSDASCLGCRDAWQLMMIQTELLWEISQAEGGGGGGTGDVASAGVNFCYTGTAPNQILKIKNLDTGLANRIDTFGADGAQTIELSNGSAC